MVLSSRTARDSLFKTPMLAESVASAAEDTATGGELVEDYLFINEFMASNDSTLPDPDEESEYPDWIEIYNAAPFAVNMGGMYLTDDLSEPTKYRIPDDVTVARVRLYRLHRRRRGNPRRLITPISGCPVVVRALVSLTLTQRPIEVIDLDFLWRTDAGRFLRSFSQQRQMNGCRWGRQHRDP